MPTDQKQRELRFRKEFARQLQRQIDGGLNKSDLAQKLEVTRGSLDNYLKCSKTPSAFILTNAVQRLDIDFQRIMHAVNRPALPQGKQKPLQRREVIERGEKVVVLTREPMGRIEVTVAIKK